MSTSMHCGAQSETFQIAERLRKEMTMAEKMLWERVCKNQLGARIRRQHPIWKFIADFYCHEVKLVIEIDGDIHLNSENREYDISRDSILRDSKLEVLRFTNNEVMEDIDRVVNNIKSTIEKLKNSAPKSPKGDFEGSVSKQMP